MSQYLHDLLKMIALYNVVVTKCVQNVNSHILRKSHAKKKKQIVIIELARCLKAVKCVRGEHDDY